MQTAKFGTRSNRDPYAESMLNICMLIYENLYNDYKSLAIKPMTIWRKLDVKTTRYNKKSTR